MQQQQQDAVQTEGCRNQANGSFVNDSTLDDLGRERFSNRSHTQGKIKPTPKLTAASTLNPSITVPYLFWHCGPTRARVSSRMTSLDHTQRRTTVDRTPLLRAISSSQRLLPDDTQQSQQTYVPAPGGNRTRNLGRRAVADLRLTPRGHWEFLWGMLRGKP